MTKKELLKAYEIGVYIPVQNAFMLISKEDYEWVVTKQWTLDKGYPKYTRGSVKTQLEVFYLHKLVLGIHGSSKEGDHRNRNPLDARRSNLRIATRSTNTANKAYKIGVSGYRGVAKTRHCNIHPWVAKITVNKKQLYLGQFATVEEAARAYDNAARKHFGEYARLNFPVGYEQKATA